MITPVCAVVAVVNGLINHSVLATLYTVVAIGVLPFGFLAVSAWVGILFPYHPMPLRYRWDTDNPGDGCWSGGSPLPSPPTSWFRYWLHSCWCRRSSCGGLTAPHGLSEKLPDHDLGLGVAVACAVAVVCSVGGQRVGVWLAQRRRAKLAEFLSDPLRG